MSVRVQNCCCISKTWNTGSIISNRALHIHPQNKYWALFAFMDVAFCAKNPTKMTSIGVFKEQLIK